MSLIAYECLRAGHAHENRQFSRAAQSLYDYFDGRDELAVLVGNINLGEANLDGLIVKNDAIIIVEFKDYEGDLHASMNGPWICNGQPIKGGASGKTVYEQLRKNQRILRRVIAENGYFTEAQRNDIQALVVLTKLGQYTSDFDRATQKWVHVADVASIGNIMHDIASDDYVRDGIRISSHIEDEDIFKFIRKAQIAESALITDFSDTTVMPPDLFDASRPHNGKYKSTATLLAAKTEELDALKQELQSLQQEISNQKIEFQKVHNEHEAIINQQKAEILAAQIAKFEAEKELSQAAKRQETPSLETLSPVTPPTPEIPESTPIIPKEGVIEHPSTPAVEQVTPPPTEQEMSPKKKRFGGVKANVLKDFDVAIDSVDDDQLDLIERTLDSSMIVAGCAGSGKSVIAMHKAQQIVDSGGDVILIAYTKSLNKYMGQGKANSLDGRFYYHWKWKDQDMPSADYMIVDEIQDFDKYEIEQFIKATKKCFFFFGDTAQSIYRAFGKKTMTIKEISELTGVAISRLYNNYRLPKPVARITQDYLGLGEPDSVSPYTEKVYLSKETRLPDFVQCDSAQSQIERMISLIKNNGYRNVGILVPDNEMVMEIMKSFTDKSFACEFKYNAGYNDKRNIDTLDFQSEHPKLMTYHSAKGLQFETVILPFYKGANSVDERKALYVAMTRTYRNLYVLFSGILAPPLGTVPERLYNKIS